MWPNKGGVRWTRGWSYKADVVQFSTFIYCQANYKKDKLCFPVPGVYKYYLSLIKYEVKIQISPIKEKLTLDKSTWLDYNLIKTSYSSIA